MKCCKMLCQLLTIRILGHYDRVVLVRANAAMTGNGFVLFLDLIALVIYADNASYC